MRDCVDTVAKPGSPSWRPGRIELANRLASEHSPYLLQHKDNPVDWQPWGSAAFEQSRREDKPIFLSVGYSTCHWCHVMEHESFEDAEVADLLNRDFVSIKVDREERPDVDRVYMMFVQATTGSGGWPMSVWLTPALQPFYGGTYFPPRSKWGRPGFVDVLREIARAWHEERGKVLQSATAIVERLRALGGAEGGQRFPGVAILEAGVQHFESAFDAERGGFGGAPKFPRPSELLYLLREYARTGSRGPRDMALQTLRAMALGGVRDHLGGGFHRYAVDADWRVPHFEKMLYDQAQLVLAYVEAGQLTGEAFYGNVARDTLEYVRRELTDREGGFLSAEDADSVPPENAAGAAAHKREGAFYTWGAEELAGELGADADVFSARFGIQPNGNAPHDPQQEFTGKNLLYVARSVDDVATETGQSQSDVEAALERARARLLTVRALRPRPGLDDKVLTAWNGLMIAAFARASRCLSDGESYLQDAREAARFVRVQLWDAADGTLRRRYRRGDAGVDGYAEDYAFLIFGLLELFQADGDSLWLDWAASLQRVQDDLFWDPDGGGWFSTTGRDASVLLRLKEEHDGAEPSANSVGVLNLLTMAHLLDDETMRSKAEQTLSGFVSEGRDVGRSMPMMLAVLSTYHAGMSQIVLAGQGAGREALSRVIRRTYLPSAVVVPVHAEHQAGLTSLLPWTASMGAPDGQAAAYLCHDRVCQAPVSAPEALAGRLQPHVES